MHRDRPAGARTRADDLGELLPARDLDPGAVEQPRGLRASVPSMKTFR